MPRPLRDPTLDVRAKKSHPLEWLLEPLEEHPGYFRRKMFGGEAVYVNGRLCVALFAGGEPWNGILLATGREFHESLVAQWKALKPHKVLGKWLYLSQSHAAFEGVAAGVVRAVFDGDPRIGVEPKQRKRKQKRNKLKPRRAQRARR